MKLLSIEAALEHFGITQIQIRQVLNAALQRGGTYADLFFEHTLNNGLNLMDNKVNRVSSNIDFGVGVRVVVGEQTGYAYLEEISFPKLLEAARSASYIAQMGGSTEAAALTNITPTHNYYPVLQTWEDKGVEQIKPYLEELNNALFQADARVQKVMVYHQYSTSHILFANSLGNLYYDYRPMSTLVANCVMQEGDRRESGSSSRSFAMGYEFFSEDLIREMRDEAISRTALLFHASQPKGGEMPVVMGAGGSGILLHEAIGHAFEADFNRKKTSIFSDKMGIRICMDSINIVDDATVTANRGALNIDDEGVPGQRTYLVKDGVLNSYMHDRISAQHYGVEPTGNGRRESFRSAPIPRMRSTYMEGVDCTMDDIISSVKQGVFVDVFSNGQVQIGAGDFTFYVKSGYLIENGKLTTPIKDINIIGNGPQALADITMVGNNPAIDNGAWTCGKGGQSCPVTCGMPSVLVSKLTVGGV